MMPPTLPPKFCIPDTVPTIFFSQTAWVSVQVFGEQMPNPQSELVNHVTATSLFDTKPAGTIKQRIARRTMMKSFRTFFSLRPRFTIQSLKMPDKLTIAEIGRYSTQF